MPSWKPWARAVNVASVVVILSLLSADFGLQVTTGLFCSHEYPPENQNNEGAREAKPISGISQFGINTDAKRPFPHYSWCSDTINEKQKLRDWMIGIVVGLKTSDLIYIALTVFLIRVGYLQVKLIDKQSTIAQQDYLATHRPRLHVSDIHLTNDFILTIAVRNRGPNHAKKIRFDAVYARLRNGNRVAPWLEELSPNQRIGPVDIERGHTAFYHPCPHGPRPDFLADDIISAMDVILIIGRMSYEDDGGVLRNTGFGWRYDPDAQRFVRPDIEDEYNYED